MAASLDFRSVIRERTRDFTGRDWVLQKIRAWLSASGPRVFLLAGEAGTGKTAIAARLVQMHLGEVPPGESGLLPKDFLAYFHFCQAGLDSTLSPSTFVQAFAEALANRYPEYRTALAGQGSRQIVISGEARVDGSVGAQAQVTGVHVELELRSGDARPLFDQVIRRPLRALCEQRPNVSIIVLVDSLDEALSFDPDTNIAQMLRLAADFPAQVRFILTSRSRNETVLDLFGAPSLELIRDAPPGLAEVRAYLDRRLAGVDGPVRARLADRIAAKSSGNFLYAYHMANDVLRARGTLDTLEEPDLPDELEGVYRSFLRRELAASPSAWNDVYRPILGLIAVARGAGLTREQLLEITRLPEDTASSALARCNQFLVGGQGDSPYGIYHDSFRAFLLTDEIFTVFPAERHAAIARYFEDLHGSNWSACTDDYALRYTLVHWAEAAALSPVQRDTRIRALVALSQHPKYRRRVERRLADLPMQLSHLQRVVEVTSLSDHLNLLPWLIKAALAAVAIHREYLDPESVVQLADQGKLEQATARLPLFMDLDDDWQRAARLILAWLAVEQNADAAATAVAAMTPGPAPALPLSLLRERVVAALARQPQFPFEARPAVASEIGRQLVNRISGQAFDRELLQSINASLITPLRSQSEMIQARAYASSQDAPLLVNSARENEGEGTSLVDEYVMAHAGYNYVEYRNASLWIVLQAVLRHHPGQAWVRDRLRRVLVAALAGGGVRFTEMLAMAAAWCHRQANGGDVRQLLQEWTKDALEAASRLQQKRGANDSWGSHRRRLTALMELEALALNNQTAARQWWDRIQTLPDGFAGFQAPARLRLADALRAGRIGSEAERNAVIEDALRSAHHVQDYHFCARVTARANAIKRWHHTPLEGPDLAGTVRRLTQSPAHVEFAADFRVAEAFVYRDENDQDLLTIRDAREARTLEQLSALFQRPVVEFRRLNPQFGLDEKLAVETLVRVPDPGLPPLLAVHLAARLMADEALEDERGALLRGLVPVAVPDPTSLDSVLAYLVIACAPDDPALADEILRACGPVTFREVQPAATQIGPDGLTPA